MLKKSILAALLVATTSAHSAQIEFFPKENPNGRDMISVSGELVSGDETKFIQLAVKLNHALILFEDSPGGNAQVGLDIGRFIRLKNFDTMAFGNCYSSCAIAWAGGVTRHVARSATIGFHNIYFPNLGNVPSAGGNAQYGAYLNSVGFGIDAIRWAAEKGANDINILTPTNANALGIHAVFETAIQPSHTSNLAKMCYTGAVIRLGSTATFGTGVHAGRRAIIVAEDSERPSCNPSNGRSGRGVIVRLVS